MSRLRGESFRLNYKTLKDPITGVEYVQLTDSRGDTIHPYFTQQLFSSDGQVMILTSTRSGSWQLYKLDIPERTMTQLTDDDEVAPHAPCLDQRRMIAYYWSGRFLKSVDLETFETSVIYVVPKGYSPTILSITPDGRYLAFGFFEELELGSYKGKGHYRALEYMYRRPRSLVVRVDLEKEEALPVWGECARITHVNISPVDPDLILFCHEGPWYLVQRMWVVNARTHEVWPLVKQKRFLESAGHEFFTKDGRVVVQYGKRSSPSSSDWIYYDIFVNPDGSDLKLYKYPYIPPVHVKVNSKATMGVGDRCFPNADFKEGSSYIGLVKYLEELVELRPLCKHGTSWLTQRSHPHPIFTPDDNYIIFSSDRGGCCNVYMASALWD